MFWKLSMKIFKSVTRYEWKNETSQCYSRCHTFSWQVLVLSLSWHLAADGSTSYYDILNVMNTIDISDICIHINSTFTYREEVLHDCTETTSSLHQGRNECYSAFSLNWHVLVRYWQLGNEIGPNSKKHLRLFSLIQVDFALAFRDWISDVVTSCG